MLRGWHENTDNSCCFYGLSLSTKWLVIHTYLILPILAINYNNLYISVSYIISIVIYYAQKIYLLWLFFNQYLWITCYQNVSLLGVCCRLVHRNWRRHRISMIDDYLYKKSHFPIQKLAKIRPSRSSEVNSPVISARHCCAKRRSSANNSPAPA